MKEFFAQYADYIDLTDHINHLNVPLVFDQRNRKLTGETNDGVEWSIFLPPHEENHQTGVKETNSFDLQTLQKACSDYCTIEYPAKLKKLSIYKQMPLSMQIGEKS